MNNESSVEHAIRDGILKLLSDDDVARIGSVESAAALADGDAYVDLENPLRVRRASANASTPTGRVIPRKFVAAKTWRDIVILLASHCTPAVFTAI